MAGLENLINEKIEPNTIDERGICVAVGKPSTSRGGRAWQIIVIHPDRATCEDYADIRRLITTDENTVILNIRGTIKIGYNLGATTRAIKAKYASGKYKATHKDVDAIMPEALYQEMVKWEQAHGIN